MTKKLEFTDVTLREGDQLPGRSYSTEQKIECGKILDEMGVSYIQVGFPVTGGTDIKAIKALATAVESDVVALSRALPSDIDAAIESEADVVEVFAPLSTKQLTNTLGKERSEMYDSIERSIATLKGSGVTPHLCLLDAFRTDPTVICDAVNKLPVVEYINLADTVGARTPKSVLSFLQEISGSVDLSDVGVHFHDDLGTATANVLAASELGVGKADVSVGGIGERAGNVPLEEIVVSLRTDYEMETEIDAERLIPCSKRVLDSLGEDVSNRKPILGVETTRHESGLHTAAMLKDPSTFEPFDPGQFGGKRSLVFGAGTGSSAARQLLQQAGRSVDEGMIDAYLECLRETGPVEKEEAIRLAETEL